MVTRRVTSRVTAPTARRVTGDGVSAGITYDYFVDGVSGNDLNDGATGETAWATFAPLRTAVNALSGETRRAYVAADTYTNDHLDFGNWSGNVVIDFEAGTVIDWTLGTDASGIQQGSGGGTLTINGNGLKIQGFDTGAGNGLGAAGTGTLIAYDVWVDDCVDGVSAHESARAETYRCSFSNCSKAPVVHVNSGTSKHVNCYFDSSNGPSLGMFAFDSAGPHEINNCTFDGGTIGNRVGRSTTGATFTNCRIGNLTKGLVNGTSGNFVKSFVHIFCEGDDTLDLDQCFGLFSVRARSGGSLIINRCVFAGEADGAARGAFFYSDFDATTWLEITVDNSIVTGYSEFGVGFGAYISYWTASGSTIDTCAIFGNTINLGSSTDDAQGVSITNVIQTDPGLGSADSLLMNDYASTNASYGFLAADAVSVGSVGHPAIT